MTEKLEEIKEREAKREVKLRGVIDEKEEARVEMTKAGSWNLCALYPVRALWAFVCTLVTMCLVWFRVHDMIIRIFNGFLFYL